MLWSLLITLALVKLAVASMMLWLPFRTDSAVIATEDPPREDSNDDEDGGTKVLREETPDPHPRQPRPRRPRRGPHGSPSPGAPRRVRTEFSRIRVRSRHVRAD
ncbi:MAG: hypothetical protein ACRDK4_07005 [Solirubrobacteraceae bacterium]